MSAQVTINLQALAHNLTVVRRNAPQANILAVIKANAYGHGMRQVAKALHAAEGYAVACLQEGVALRESGVTKKIVVLQGFSSHDALLSMQAHGLTPVLHSKQQLDIIRSITLEHPIPVWLKVDTGMGRLGLSVDEWHKHWPNIKQNPLFSVECLMTHFSSADSSLLEKTTQQLSTFQSLQLIAQKIAVSLANSAAVLVWPSSHHDWVRPGIMLYGVSPFPNTVGTEHDLRPVMTLKAPLIALRQHRKGETIGYGDGENTWHCPEDMPIGMVAIGYGDGYPRHIKAGTEVLLNGQRVPVIGRVSMDILCIDLRQHNAACIGDKVTCWGEGLPVEYVAQQADTLPYELLCQVTHSAAGRTEFIYQ